MLSVNYQIGEDYRAKTWDELLALGDRISNGTPASFDEAELAQVEEHIASIERLTPYRLLRDGFYWLWPILLVTALLIIFAITRRSL